MMKFTLIVVLVISSGTVLSSALSCFNLERKASNDTTLCYIQENADKEYIDKELVGPTSKCTNKDIKEGIAVSVTNSSFCFMAVLRGTGSATAFNSSTTVMHSVVLVQRGAGFSVPPAADCLQQCKHIETLQDIDNAAPKNTSMNRTLLYFACRNGDNTNGDDATNYKNRTDKFNCDKFKLSQTPVTAKPFPPLWLIIVIAVVVAALVLLIIVAVVVVCVRRKKAQPFGAHPNAAYRAQQNADEPAAALNP